MYSLYRITSIRPKTLGMYGALAAAIMSVVELLFGLLYVLLLGGFFFSHEEFSSDTLFLLIPTGIGAVVTVGIGFAVGWCAAVVYNRLHPLIGTLSIRLSKPYVRN